MNRILCVWLPNWPVQRVQAVDPELAKQPWVLTVRDARRGVLVAAANLAARAAGIRPAMRLSEAGGLAELEIREHDSQEDMDGLCNLCEAAQQFSPIVGLEQLDKKTWAGRTLHQPECLLLDVTGLANLFGGEAKLMDEVGQWLAGQRYFGCMAIADSLGAAWGLANYGTRRLPAEIAAKMPSQPMELPVYRCLSSPAGQTEAIEALPLSALRMPIDTIQALQRLGLRCVGELGQFPRAGLGTRLGDALLVRWDQMMGRQNEPVVTQHALPDWILEQTLEFPTEHRETIVELVRRLSSELSRRLARRGEGALRLVCRLDLVQRPPLLMQLGLFRPTNDSQHVEMLLVGQLEQQLRGVRTAPLWRISLQATLTAPMVWRQADLFDGNQIAERHEVARLVDRLSCRLGRKQVLGAKVGRDAQPESAVNLQPLTGRRQDGGSQSTVRKLSSRLARRRAEPSPEDPLRRPTQLFNPPLAIEVAGAWRAAPPENQRNEHSTAPNQATSEPESGVAAAPAAIHYQKTWHHVADARGPERLESGWWKGPSARRDYYRIVTSRGAWWWIYRDLNTGLWYVHGMFD